MLFGQYLKEIRWRGAYLCLGLVLAIVIGYKEVDSVFFILLEPLNDCCNLTALVSLDITEAFFSQLHVAALAGMTATVPFFWIQVWLFLRPSLHRREVGRFQTVIVVSLCLILGALYFSGVVLVPQAWSFFLSYTFTSKTPEGVGHIDYLPCLWPYLNLTIQVVQMVLLTFQLPILVFLLKVWGWLDIRFLWNIRPWVIILTLSWAAAISPPDLLSQLFIFGPIFFFYEISIYTLFVCSFIQTSYEGHAPENLGDKF